MGLIVDTNVLICAERGLAAVDFSPWAAYGNVFISAVTCSELLVGVHLANTPERRIKRAAFVEALLEILPVLDFDKDAARVHAELTAALPQNAPVGAHDLIIGATAIRHGFPVLTGNFVEFSRMPGSCLARGKLSGWIAPIGRTAALQIACVRVTTRRNLRLALHPAGNNPIRTIFPAQGIIILEFSLRAPN